MKSDPEKLFSYDLMMEHFQKFGRLGLIYAATALPLITSEKEKEKEINMDEWSSQCSEGNAFAFNSLPSEESQIMYQRMRDVVIDMSRLGYI